MLALMCMLGPLFYSVSSDFYLGPLLVYDL